MFHWLLNGAATSGINWSTRPNVVMPAETAIAAKSAMTSPRFSGSTTRVSRKSGFSKRVTITRNPKAMGEICVAIG